MIPFRLQALSFKDRWSMPPSCFSIGALTGVGIYGA